MVQLTKLKIDFGDADITAVAMDNRFIVVGLEDGKVAVVYNETGMPAFNPIAVPVSENKITAVCADDNEDYFYVGDQEGSLFTLNKKGKVLATSKMPGNIAGAVLSIGTIVGKSTFRASSSKGHTTFKDANTEKISHKNIFTSSANFSMDGDGKLYANKEDGSFQVLSYNPDTEARVVSTVALRENSDSTSKKFMSVAAFVIADNDIYASSLQLAIKTLSIRKGKKGDLGTQIKSLEFDAAVRQVISCRHHTGGDAESDDIYVLLCNGDLLKYNGTQLFDRSVKTKDLEKEEVVTNEDYEERIDEYLDGFAVYEKKVVIYGSDGLYVGDV